MNTIKGVIQHGQVVLEEPTNWPDGTAVTVTPQVSSKVRADSADDGPMTPEEVARTLAAMEKVEPFEMTDAERADIEKGRRKIKDYTLANQDKIIDGLFQ